MANFEIVKTKYKALRFNSISSYLDNLVKKAEAQEISYLQFAEMLVEHELNGRNDNRTSLNMKRAGFPAIKQLEEFDFTFQTTITRK